jgi:ribosomal-protein-alanine N-acetyltransferase
VTIVTIVTPRLLLRDFTDAERPAFLAYQADPRYLAFSGSDEGDPARALRLIQTFREWAAEHPRRNYQLAIVQRQEAQALVGCCGLRQAGYPVGSAELGIELAPAYWGRHGYAIEVGRALLEFAFGELRLEEVRGVTVSANVRATRLAEWFGAETIAVRPGAAWVAARGWSEIEWRIPRARWERGAAG